MKTPKTPAFVAKLEKVAMETDVALSFWDKADDRTEEVVEDDGALIIRKNGIRAVFDIGQDRPLHEQNYRMEKVLKALGLDKPNHIKMSMHSDDDLRLEEDEEEQENGNYECPWCGRRHN